MPDMSQLPPSTQKVVLPVDMSISADWKHFVSDAAKALVELFTKGPADAAATGVGGLLNLATSFKAERSPGHLAWVLTISATAWAIQDTITLDEQNRNLVLKALRSALNDGKSQLDRDGLEFPLDFFTRPTRLPFYVQMSDNIIREIYQEDDRKRREAKYKIDAAFARGIFLIYSSKHDYYAPLFSLLLMPDSPSSSLENAWSAYRAKLRYDFCVRPIFGQEVEKISLSQLYVPLRGVWLNEEFKSREEFTEQSEYGYDIVSLDETLDEWLNNNETNDYLRLIGGGPGSGKSTTLKALASRSSNLASFRPLFIPLQYINFDSDLREAINKFFTESTDSAFTEPPLSRSSVEDGAPLLLIFDGLDELSAPGEAAKDIVGTFATRLHSLIATLTGSGSRIIKVVVSGRMPAFQAAKRYLPVVPHAALETHGFLPRLSQGDGNPLWLKDQRPDWWKQYAELKNLAPEVPEAFSSEKLDGITNEPLLCYLLALSGYANEHWELAADNRNRIYSSLIESIYDRGWGDGQTKRLGAGKSLKKNDFIKLMETIALAAWLGGDTRVASAQKFEETVEITRAGVAWTAFTNDNGQDVGNLAMNFYLKSSERSERGFEFTHKSFGEYLASRAILSVAMDVSSQIERRLEFALQDWLRATKTGAPSKELLAFLRDELRQRIADEPDQYASINDLKLSFETLIAKVATDGFPMIPGNDNWRAAEREQGNAECCLWMVVNACAYSMTASGKGEGVTTNISWTQEEDFSDILRRLSRIANCDCIFQCVSHIDISGQTVTSLRAPEIDLSHSNLSSVTFVALTCSGDFSHSKLDSSRFYLCTLDGVDFSHASANGLIFHATNLRDVKFESVNNAAIIMTPISYISTLCNIDDDILSNLQLMQSDNDDCERISKIIQARAENIGKIPCDINDDLVCDFDSLRYRQRKDAD